MQYPCPLCARFNQECVFQCLQNEIRSLVTLGDGAAGGGTSVSYEVGRRKKKRKESASGPQLFDNDVEWWGGEEVRTSSLYILHVPNTHKSS